MQTSSGSTGTILVIGATGTIGSELVKWLASINASVKAAVHTTEKADLIRAPTVQIVEIDHGNKETYTAAFQGVEKIFLLTPLSPDMVGITQRLVDSAKKAEVKHLVKLSALGASVDALTGPLQWHYQADQLVRDSNIPYTILQPNFFMQNLQMFFGPSMHTEGKIYAPLGNSKVSMIDARDISMVAGVVLTKSGHEGKTYMLTGSQALTFSEIATALSKALKKEISYVSVPEEQTRTSLEQAKMPPWMIDALLGIYSNLKAGHMAAVTTSVKDIAGKMPITFEQFAKEYASVLIPPGPSE